MVADLILEAINNSYWEVLLSMEAVSKLGLIFSFT